MEITYKSLSGLDVYLNDETVLRYCVKGGGRPTEAEIAGFIRTCAAKKLDPLEAGEVYLVKYNEGKPATLTVGYGAYIRRADANPNYRGYKAGITVFRGNEVVQKEGQCVYSEIGEKLIGGWCKVFRQRGTYMDETFVEVALSDYNSGKNLWSKTPATMIRKVAISQAFRNAFPNEYEGLYSDGELIASGAIGADMEADSNEGKQAKVAKPKEEQPKAQTVAGGITREQRKALFDFATAELGDKAQEKLKEVLKARGLESTAELTTGDVAQVMKELSAVAKEMKEAEKAEAQETEE